MAQLVLDREPIFDALAARLRSKCPTLKDVKRRYAPPQDISERPVALLLGGSQLGTVRRGAPTVWALGAVLVLYVRADEGDAATPPSTQIHALTREVELALTRDDVNEPPVDMTEPYATNLGLPGVFSCRLTEVSTDEGLLDPEGEAVLSIQIEARP